MAKKKKDTPSVKIKKIKTVFELGKIKREKRRVFTDKQLLEIIKETVFQE